MCKYRRHGRACPGRGAAFFTLLRRAGTVPNTALRYGPGSAAHRFARATRCAASGERREKCAMEDRVKVTMLDGVADVRLNRAEKMNALDAAMFDGLVATID